MVHTTPETDEERYVPENEALCKVYLFAEALGGYEALNDLSSKYSPGQTLSQRYGKKAKVSGAEAPRSANYRGLSSPTRWLTEKCQPLTVGE